MNRLFPQSEEERKFFLRALATIAVPLALITLIPSCAGVVAVNRLSKDRADEAKRTAAAVTESRAEITYTTCLDDNERNLMSVALVDDRVTRRKGEIREAIQNSSTPAEAAALRAQIDALDDGRDFSVDLIDAVIPKRDCEQIVFERFGYVPDVNGP